ncbi:hypothetical protein SAMN06265795_106199 [Noviherbaspirillum humi]|uniref:ATP synthase I chain n=1 Tax=Noviherbaspirillum humi TaxID=1688639 RepID=A0A239HEJ6_9BURK|nr:hypothetical protein [Noviherbaspirillum humi]SNS79223.1 hypothetical protein SAMN06265795_106199 [Noviherbaspirillum humi]
MLQLIIRVSIMLVVGGLALTDGSGNGLFMGMWASAICYVIGLQACRCSRSLFSASATSEWRTAMESTRLPLFWHLTTIATRAVLLTITGLVVRFQTEGVSFTLSEVLTSLAIVMLAILAMENLPPARDYATADSAH